MLRTLIIDDSPRSRSTLRRLLSAHANIEIVGEAGNVTDARERLLAQLDYDLVLLDIQLIGGSGFDLVPDISTSAHIIFATAFEEHAVRAFEINALDYILKPVTAERLANALQRIEQPDRSAAPRTVERVVASDSLFLPTPNGQRFVSLPDITVIASEQNYTLVHLADGSRHLIQRTMKEWDNVLPPDAFIRIHRQHIINASRVTGVTYDLLGRPRLYLAGYPDPLWPSRRQWAEVRDLIPNT
ncbi:MAG: LytTR family DNA-binding domain-containing protein [Synoicihabitans sp.]